MWRYTCNLAALELLCAPCDLIDVLIPSYQIPRTAVSDPDRLARRGVWSNWHNRTLLCWRLVVSLAVLPLSDRRVRRLVVVVSWCLCVCCHCTVEVIRTACNFRATVQTGAKWCVWWFPPLALADHGSSSITGGLIKNEWKTLLLWSQLSFPITNNGESDTDLFALADEINVFFLCLFV